MSLRLSLPTHTKLMSPKPPVPIPNPKPTLIRASAQLDVPAPVLAHESGGDYECDMPDIVDDASSSDGEEI